MRKFYFIFLLFFSMFSVFSIEKTFFVGPHFNYENVSFIGSESVDGYAGGLTTGFLFDFGCLNTKVFFEGTWNAIRLTADPSQVVSTNEYYVQGELGRDFSLCNFCVRPYLGFGWDRFENIQQPKSAALCYRYDKLFIPIGAYFTWERCCELWTLQFEFRPDVWSCLDLLSVGLEPHWGYAFRSQLIYDVPYITCYGCFRVQFIPFFDWNRFGKIEEANSFGGTLTIPELTRWYLGLRMAISYNF